MKSLRKKVYPFIGEEVYFTVLDNGMKVYLLPKPDFQETSAMLTVDFGSIDTELTVNGETKIYPQGLAHFLEHQLFEREDSLDVAQLFTKNGADSNAYTSFERTSYFFSTISNLEESLKLLQEFIVNPKFTTLSIEKEKGIICQEIEMYLDDPEHRLYNGLLNSLYPQTPLAQDIAGTTFSVGETSLSDLQDMVDFFYHPSHFTLVLSGPFDVRYIHHFLLKNQVDNPVKEGSEVLKHHLKLAPVLKGRSVRMDVSMAKLALGLRAQVLEGTSILRQKIALHLLFSMLFGWTSQTYQTWYEAGKINDAFDFEIEVSARFQFAALFMDTNQPIAMVNQIKHVLRRFQTSPDINNEHLLTVKKEFYGEFVRSLDSVDDVVNQFITYVGQGQNYYDIPEILKDLSLEEIVSIGGSFLEVADLADFTIFPR